MVKEMINRNFQGLAGIEMMKRPIDGLKNNIGYTCVMVSNMTQI
ncbi:3242_t:CDS:2 [Rhizophagus irregularis]|nr:3242_t:CDS:2 [Rhizophagus irregularis]